DRLGETGALQLQVSSMDSTATRDVTIPLQRWLAGEEEPDLLGVLGLMPWHQVLPARLGDVLPDGRAAEAGLQAGDLILTANGEPVADWSQWLEVVQNNAEQQLHISLERDGLIREVQLQPAVRLAEDGSQEAGADGQ